ncbi:MAG: DUF2235 domain-containing protein [Aquabacterium sp.]|uniref:DUF2235 domain-containing protein n=1 Tax=Aquabacterium sp. TaxID=1872578 RepID=UPI00121FEC3B|nr:DUF2235 domain-containing protein [Aquabacterium sp.]TAK93726.1 MAG: DUF2235 domain-containing protein [Aquabacterium sp.]
MSKNIIFCADGTWNSPGQDDNRDGTPDCTNVYKTFLALSGALSPKSLLDAGEQEKALTTIKGVQQVAKYIHGVGDSHNPIQKLLGGATGAGTIARIIRGYTFISRHYEPGDQIYIIGFSRGAYTARALAGLICSQGLLKGINYDDEHGREKAYLRASQVWYRYEESHKTTHALAKLISAVAYLPGFITHNEIGAEDLQAVPEIAAVGVWDTVGAMGIPDIFGDGDKHDAYQFADLKLNPKIRKGFHAVSLDERRAPFMPTLWTDDSDRVEQVIFPGAHADVGGGYPECGLSDIALGWMLDKLAACGVQLDKPALKADPGATAHEPWKSVVYTHKCEPRPFDGMHKIKLQEDPAIAQRCALPAVKPDPSKAAEKYTPSNRPKKS